MNEKAAVAINAPRRPQSSTNGHFHTNDRGGAEMTVSTHGRQLRESKVYPRITKPHACRPVRARPKPDSRPRSTRGPRGGQLPPQKPTVQAWASGQVSMTFVLLWQAQLHTDMNHYLNSFRRVFEAVPASLRLNTKESSIGVSLMLSAFLPVAFSVTFSVTFTSSSGDFRLAIH